MKIYTVHAKPLPLDADADLVLVKDGFHWLAFLFGGFWALAHGMWVVGAALLVLILGVGTALDLYRPELGLVWHVVSSLAVGLFAPDLRAWHLDRKGFVTQGVVYAEDRETATHRALDQLPDLARDLRMAAEARP